VYFHLHPEDISNPKSHSTISRPLPFRGLYPFEVLTASGSFHTEILSILKALAPNVKLQQHIIFDLRWQLCSSILPRVHNV